jgi:hypothetical protein
VYASSLLFGDLQQLAEQQQSHLPAAMALSPVAMHRALS